MTNNQLQSVAKVPAITLVFWVIKILATTFGETAGDDDRKLLSVCLESCGFLPVRFWHPTWPKQTLKEANGHDRIAPKYSH